MKKIIAIGGAAALVMAGAAVAQQSDPRSERWGDADGDGRVARAELVDRHVTRLQSMDADNNGVVTAAERTAARQAHMAERRDARFARLDADGNGAITRAEFDAGYEQREARRGEGGRRHGGNRHGGRGGRHGAASGDVVIADVRARMNERFTRMDVDADGFVTSDERRAMMGERRGRRAATPPSTE